MNKFFEMNLIADTLEELNNKIEDAYCYGYEKNGEIKKEDNIYIQNICRAF